MTVATKLAALAAALILCGTAHAQTPAAAPTPKPAVNPAKPAAPRAKPPIQQQQTVAPGHNVCVVPAIGHKFDVQAIGIMIFGNKLEEPSIETWGIDDIAVRKVAAVLGRQYAVRRIDLSKAALETYEGKHPLFHSPNDDFMAGLRAAAGPAKCDFIIALTRANTPFSTTNQNLNGLGILRREALVDAFYVFANFDVRLYDGNTFALVRSEFHWTDPPLLGALTGPGIRGMYRRVDKSWWPADGQAAVQSAQLRTATRELVEQSLAKAVPKLFGSEDPAAAQAQAGGGANYIGGRND